MEEEVDYEYQLSFTLGRFRRELRSSDFLQGSKHSSIELRCLDLS